MDRNYQENIRTTIQTLVSSIQPMDQLEKEHVHFTLNWMGSGASIFRGATPTEPKPHLVSYFIIIDPDRKKILLVDLGEELWLPTGGHVENNENPKDTVIREAFEELGIAANFLSDEPIFLAITESIWFTAKHTDISLWYLLKMDSASTRQISFNTKEIKQIQWFDFDRIPYLDPHLKRFMEKITVL